MNRKLQLLGAALVVTALSASGLKAQSTNLIDVQIAGTYNGAVSTNAVGAAVLGTTGDVWNQYGQAQNFNSGSFPAATAVNLVTGVSSGASFAATMSGGQITGTLPAGNANGFTAKTGAPTATVTNLFSGTTDYLNIGNTSSSVNVIFTFTGLTAYIGNTFIYDIYYGGAGTASTLTGATGGNTASSLSATGADANINNAFNTNTGVGDSYVQYTGTITGSTLTFNATMPPVNLGGNGWGGCLVGAQLQLVDTNPPPSSFLWSNSPSDASWTNGANWAGGTAPTTNQLLVFATSSITTVSNNFASGSTFTGISFATNASAYTVNGSNITMGSQGLVNASSNNQTINVALAGASAVNETGTGTLTLSNTNSYTGATTVNSGGSLVLSGSLSNSAIANSGTFTETTNGSISGSVGLTASAGTTTLAGVNTYSGTTTVNSGASLTLSGSLSNSAIASLGTITETTNGTISGSAGLTVNGGMTTLAGNNTNSTGSTSISGGTLQLQANTGNTVGGVSYALSADTNRLSFANATLQLRSDSNVTFAGGNGMSVITANVTQNYNVDGVTPGVSNQVISFATNGYASFNTTINVTGQNDGYTLALGPMTVGFAPYTTIAVTANGADLQLAGVAGMTGMSVGGSNNTTVTGAITGTGGVTKNGSGTLIMGGSNTYGGTTLITSGTLVVSGSISGTTNINIGTLASEGTLDVSANPAFTAGTNQTLSGFGVVNDGSGTVTVNGNVTPGSIDGTTRGVISIGDASNASSLNLGTTAVTSLKLVTNGIEGTAFDAVSVSDTLTFNGALKLVVNNTPSVGTYDLFTATAISGDFTAVGLFGTWNPGSFAETAPNTWTYSDPTFQWTFDSANGQLAVSAVPEASNLALLGLGLLLSLITLKRLNRKLENAS